MNRRRITALEVVWDGLQHLTFEGARVACLGRVDCAIVPDTPAGSRVAAGLSGRIRASERVDVIRELQSVIDKQDVVEADLQDLVARAPWLIRPDWSVINENQGLQTFRDQFASFLNASAWSGAAAAQPVRVAPVVR